LWSVATKRKALAGLSPSLPVRFHGDQETEISQTETLPPMNHVTEGQSIHRVKTYRLLGCIIAAYRYGLGSAAFSRIAS
jgi:hypothetical protein